MTLSAALTVVAALVPAAAGARQLDTPAAPAVDATPAVAAMPAMTAMPKPRPMSVAAPAPAARPNKAAQALPPVPAMPSMPPMPKMGLSITGDDRLAMAELVEQLKRLGADDALKADKLKEELKFTGLDLDGMKLDLERAAMALQDNASQLSADTRIRLEDARKRADEAQIQAAEAALRSQEKALTIRGPFPAGDNAYNAGLSLLNERRFDMAIQMFDRVIAGKEARADGAMYHKAFAQSRSGRTQEALDTIAALRKDYPQSRYLADAKVLEADVRRLAGQPINLAAAEDDEIKLLAINGLQKSDQAIPLLEGVLAAANSLRVKKQALFVLAGNDDPRARAILLRHAKGDGNPDLQMEAIRRLVSRRDGQTTNQDLKEIYNSTQDTAVRLSVIDAYRSSSDKASLIAIAGNRTTAADLRVRAVMSLPELASPDELWTLYQSEADAALRTQMVSAFGSMRAIDQLTRIARADADMGVRRRAISSLGSLRGESAAKSRQTLMDLYTSQTDTSVKMSIINALNNTESADALVALARKETSLELKRELVRRISDMAPRSKAAADYLMEVIK